MQVIPSWTSVSRQTKTEVKRLTATSSSMAEPITLDQSSYHLVQPSDELGWQQLDEQYASLQLDNPYNPGIAYYQSMAQAPLREQLKAMIGVDVYV